MEGDQSVIQQPNREDFGKSEYGCEHYRRRCKLRAPCCDQIFSCRHCHNAAASALSNPKDHHELVRRDVSQVICAVCDTEQQVAHVCSKCGVKMGEYFCEICRFYDDDTTKQQFHCDDCGICRVGGRERYFHCKKCGEGRIQSNLEYINYGRSSSKSILDMELITFILKILLDNL